MRGRVDEMVVVDADTTDTLNKKAGGFNFIDQERGRVERRHKGLFWQSIMDKGVIVNYRYRVSLHLRKLPTHTQIQMY